MSDHRQRVITKRRDALLPGSMLRPAHGGWPEVDRVCHFCGEPIDRDEKAIRAKTMNAWAHFTCWYSGANVGT